MDVWRARCGPAVEADGLKSPVISESKAAVMVGTIRDGGRGVPVPSSTLAGYGGGGGKASIV